MKISVICMFMYPKAFLVINCLLEDIQMERRWKRDGEKRETFRKTNSFREVPPVRTPMDRPNGRATVTACSCAEFHKGTLAKAYGCMAFS